MMRGLDPQEFDGVIVCSGDGVLHEVVNGLMSRPDAGDIDIPVGAIPVGTGNGVIKSVLHL